MFNYTPKTHQIEIGRETILIECIADLNRTIDEWFEKFPMEELCPYFGTIWASARALCQVLSEESEALRDRTVLEVGCGLALPSLLCAKLGARVTATDFHPEVPRFLARNIELNGAYGIQYFSHDWNSENSRLGEFDWVIGSDILYERQHPEAVANALARHCKADGRILLADPARPYLQRFSDEMNRLGYKEKLRVLTVPDEPQPKDVFVLSYS